MDPASGLLRTGDLFEAIRQASRPFRLRTPPRGRRGSLSVFWGCVGALEFPCCFGGWGRGVKGITGLQSTRSAPALLPRCLHKATCLPLPYPTCFLLLPTPLRPSGTELGVPASVPSLRFPLLPHQQRAVCWMLARERAAAGAAAAGGGGEGAAAAAGAEEDHPLWAPVPRVRDTHHHHQHTASPAAGAASPAAAAPAAAGGGGSGAAFYVNLYSGAVSSSAFPGPDIGGVGILADEMVS